MTLFHEPNMTAGIDNALVTTAQNVPAFPIMILVFTFFVIVIGGSSSQKKRVGAADVPFWCALGGLSTTFMALVMTIGDGIIDLLTLGVVIGVTVMCGLWFFLSKTKGEQ